jgi:hypothetical protein
MRKARKSAGKMRYRPLSRLFVSGLWIRLHDSSDSGVISKMILL